MPTIEVQLGSPPAKLKSKTHKQLEAALKKATKNKKEKLSKQQSSTLQNADYLTYQTKSDEDKLNKIYEKLGFTIEYKKVKGKRARVVSRNARTKTPTAVQQLEINKLEDRTENYAIKRYNLVRSKKYKQAESHFKKLNKKAKKAYTNLFKYETKRHVRSIAKRVHKTNYDDILAPHAQIFETGAADGFTLYLFAQSENEANTTNITKYPTDRDDPIVDHVRKSDKTLTISGYLRGPKSYPGASKSKTKLKSAEYYYEKLLKWETGGTQLSYRSNSRPFTQVKSIPHIYMKHLYIQSLNKVLEQATADTIKIELTLSFNYPATVLTNKRNVNAKGKKSKSGKYAGAKHIKVRRGQTYWQLAKQYGTTVKQLEKWNGPKLLAGAKIQVTQGKLISKPKRTSKSKIYQKRR